MKVSYNWLKDYINIDDSPSALADYLTGAGIEVEEIDSTVPEFSGVVVGRVLETSKHPDADKLSLCRVTDGREAFQVICGAPNVKAGQLVPFARVGASLAGGFKIKKAKIRGVESHGMICSKEELGLEKSSDGIWALEQPELEPGEDFHALLMSEQDYIFDLFITPNRPDCLSMTGIARELGAITDRGVNMPAHRPKEHDEMQAADYVKISIDTAEGCPRYAARVIKDVRVGPSPGWMVKRLESVGIRSINNVVDITNYVLMELGHPLHAFDLNRISGNEINVRYSFKNEKFVTLDEKERVLPENTVLICDAQQAVAIGGIMGGLNSEVTDDTTDILLEAAYFKRERIADSSKKLGLSTEASQRFERGADPEGVINALDRAADLLVHHAGGTVAAGVVDAYPGKVKLPVVDFRSSRVNHVLGTDYSDEKITDLLRRLGFRIEKGKVIVPSYRVDVHQEIDLVEEVARLVSYDHLPTRETTVFPYERAGGYEADLQFDMLRQRLIELGLLEALTNSMIKKSEAETIDKSNLVSIINPISDDMVTMRPSLLPGLLKSVAFNLNRNNETIRLFELGRVFRSGASDNPVDQPYKVAGIICGSRKNTSWEGEPEPVDFYDIKGIFETFAAKIFLDKIRFILYDNHEYLDPAEAVEIAYRDTSIGYCGKIGGNLLNQYDIDVPVYAFEVDLEPLRKAVSTIHQYEPVPRFPYVEKDMALVLDEAVTADEVIAHIQKVGGKLLKNVRIFDVYHGGNVPEGKKSLAFRMRFQSAERTLSDDEVDDIFKKVIKKAEDRFKAQLRN